MNRDQCHRRTISGTLESCITPLPVIAHRQIAIWPMLQPGGATMPDPGTAAVLHRWGVGGFLWKWSTHRKKHTSRLSWIFLGPLLKVNSESRIIQINLTALHLVSNNPVFTVFFLLILTLNVRGPSYLGLTRSISRLLMSWLLTSPGHQQPWYWLWRMCKFWSYLRKDVKYLCHINVE